MHVTAFLRDNAWQEFKQNLCFNSGFYFKKSRFHHFDKNGSSASEIARKNRENRNQAVKCRDAQNMKQAFLVLFYVLNGYAIRQCYFAIALSRPILSRTYGRLRRPNREEYRKQDQAHDQPMR